MPPRARPRPGTPAAATAAVTAAPAVALAQMGLPEGASPTMDAIADLFQAFTVLGGLVTLTVLALLAGFVWRYRERPGDAREGPVFREVYTPRQRRALAAAFVVVPAAILAAVGVVSYGVYTDIGAPPDSLHVNVTGMQFSWIFTHPNGTQTLDTLHVPANETIVLHVTSRDVVHSFFVPELGVKVDAVPGRVNVFSFRALAPGEYAARCTEFCGVGHAGMEATVVVAPAGDV